MFGWRGYVNAVIRAVRAASRNRWVVPLLTQPFHGPTQSVVEVRGGSPPEEHLGRFHICYGSRLETPDLG